MKRAYFVSRYWQQIGHSVILLLFFIFWAGPQTAYAASFTIACNDAAGLIAAINTANSNGQADIITLGTNCTYTLTNTNNPVEGANGLPDITSDITIAGNGSTIIRASSAPAFRLFHVASSGVLTLQNLTLMQGQADGGAAIYSHGTVNITNSTIRNQQGGSYGAIVSDGPLTIDQSTVAENSAANAGALLAAANTTLITRSTFRDNQAVSNDGGAIFVGDGANITIANSTFANNSAVGYGGVLVTIAGSPAVPPTVNIINSTLNGNSAGSGALYVFQGSVTLQNTIVAYNAGGNCAGTTSAGNNLSSDDSCGGGPADNSGIAPQLGPLANNGGATETYALLPGSPAINGGNTGICTTAPVNSVDQRGAARSATNCDIGAVEHMTTFEVTTTADSGPGSLRQAILDANASPNTNGPDAIYFNIEGSSPHTIQPTSQLPSIDDPVIIDGSTQSGADCTTWPPVLKIELSGVDAGSPAWGLTLNASGNIIRGLVINRFSADGIFAAGGHNIYQCNFIGTDVQGTTALGNAQDGIFDNGTANNLIGGVMPGQGNLIAGNGAENLRLATTTNSVVQGNIIGLDVNGNNGLGFNIRGILLTGSNNLIGGTATAARNVIAGSSFGFDIAAGSGNIIQGNYIGTNAPGNASRANTTGIWVTGSASNTLIQDNLIAGNSQAGVLLDGASSQTTLRGNWIGVQTDGVTALGNSQQGVDVKNATNNTIGVVGAGNIIAHNGGDGVRIEASNTGNSIRGNSIFANGGLGIDLGGDGVTFNHQGDIAGPNNYQNYPVLTLVASDGVNTRVKGTMASGSHTNFNLDLYANPTCDPSFFGEGQTYLGSFPISTDAGGDFDQVLPVNIPEPQGVSATATDVTNGNTSEFSYCHPASTPNVNWQAAQTLPLAPVGTGTVGATVQQRIVDRFQEKWFKFAVQPGDVVHIKLTSLPGSAVSLHQDPHSFYNSLTNPQSAAVLSAEAADSGFLPSGYLPSGYLPSGYLPSGYLPSGYLPSGYLPSGYLPSGYLPSGYLPSSSLPSGYLPSGYLPSGYLPTGSLPTGALPSGYLPSGYLPSGYLPSGYLPEAYSGAARRSLMAISLDPNATVQTIDRNTYDILGDLYVRVVGPYDLANPFTLEVTVEGGVCSAIQAVPDSVPVTPNPAAGAYQTLILTHSGRLPGTPDEIAGALQRLRTLAARADVNGVVVDLNDAQYQRVAWANDQADRNLACSTAKNVVATEIKRIVDGYRAANVDSNGKTTLQYIVLAGGANTIPYFQVPDIAGLANEKDYVVPVKPSTASEAGLKTNLVQGQDNYGTQTFLNRGDHTFAVPDLAVGRLVDTANDISTVVDAYIATNGVITPRSSLVTGYDFVGDAADAIKVEADAGTNSIADHLIQEPGLPPTDRTAWSANDLRSQLFTKRHDLIALSGHFSAGNLLAADYQTNMPASEITASTIDFTNVLVLTLGCHGGYTIPSADLLTDASPDPDWAKAFLRKKAAGYIAATGYAYGDTELTEYGERLFVTLAQQLRTGTEPVALGQALVAAKQRYLAQSAQVTGIDEKTLVEMTLYGLPMMKVNMPGQRITPPSDPSIVTAPASVTTGPGADFGLSVSQPTVTPALTPHTVQLTNLNDNSTIPATYLSSKDGVVANPFEPIFPKALYNVSANGVILRGVAFRGGDYTDQSGVTPLTTAPATETSRPHTAFNSDVFYPSQVWLSNYFDALKGGVTRLVTVPGQFKSTAPGSTDGILRSFTNLNFNLYYLPSNWTTGSASVKAAAVAAAPVILGASAGVNSNQVTFNVNAQADGSAGVQAVWVLYTGKSGSALYGKWQPLDLAQTNVTLDPTAWSGTLALPSGADASDLLFMVEAVNGAGLTTLATNLGAYYTVTPATPPPPPQATGLDLQAPPSSGAYLQNNSFTALLTTNGQPVANQTVVLNLGGQTVWAATDANGQATFVLQPGLLPGDYPMQVTFAGNTNYQRASTIGSFTVLKDSTSLALTPQAPSVVATLRDSANRPLSLKSVSFVVSGNGLTFARSVSTDLVGNAALGAVPLPPGTYTVDAYFSGAIPVGNNQTVTLNDDYYEPSHATGSVTLVDTTPPVVAVTFPTPPVAQNGWFNAQDAANGIIGSVTANDTTTGLSKIAAINCSGATVGPITGLNTVQANAALTVAAEGSNAISCTASDSANNSGAAPGSTNTATVKLDKTAPDTTITTKPNNPSSTTTAAFEFTGSDGAGSGIARFECQLDGAAFAACTSPQSYANLSEGAHTFAVRAVDVAGNVNATPASYGWTISTATVTPTPSNTATATSVNTATPAPSNTATPVRTVAATPPASSTPRATPTKTATATPTPKNTATPLPTQTPTPTKTATATPGGNTLVGVCGPYTVYRTPQGKYVAAGWNGNIIIGTSGPNSLSGGSANDLILGLGGNDQLIGGGGTDVLCGNDGDDKLDGGSGADLLIGGAGNDSLIGGSDNDILQGEAGNDVLDSGSGNDTLTGGTGADGFNGGSGTDRATDLNVAEGDKNNGGIEFIGPAATLQAEPTSNATEEGLPSEKPLTQLFLPLVTK